MRGSSLRGGGVLHLCFPCAIGNGTKTETPGEDMKLPMFERREDTTGGRFLSAREYPPSAARLFNQILENQKEK